MSYYKKGFFILFLLIFLSMAAFSIGYAFAQDIVDLGLAGHWSNNYGYFQAIEVLDSNDISYNGEKGAYYAFCATSKGMAVFSIYKDEKGLKRQSVKVSIKSFIPIGECTDIEIWKDEDNNIFAYLTGGDKGLHIIKIVHPESLYYIANIDTPDSAQGVAISQSGDYAFVADGRRGLQIIDISDPTSPSIVGSCNTPGYAEGVAISQSDDYAFVADGYRGLQVIYINDPTSPSIVGGCNTPGYAEGVAISQSGDFAFVADGESGLLVIDISDPTSPHIVGTCDTPDDALGVAISQSGDFAFVADGESGLQVIGIINLKRLSFVFGTYGPARGVAISGRYAFVTYGYSGLLVIDISDPTSPHIVGSCDTHGYAQEVAISQSGEFCLCGLLLWVAAL